VKLALKLFDSISEQVGKTVLTMEAETIPEVLEKLSRLMGRREPLSIEDNICLFRNGINVEFYGGEYAPLHDEDWLAVFPRVKRKS
jgi:molybdopterin converting factor small subunit